MMTTRLFTLLLLLGLTSTILHAQELSWRKHKSLAESLAKEGDFYAAAENYRMAWEKKQSKAELIYLAAENYAKVSDYRSAAEAYQHVDVAKAEDPLVLLKYGRALKQDGQYDKARTVFQQLLDTYTGTDKAILQDIVRMETRGIDLTRDMATNADRRLEVLHQE
ncbi:MAG: hypothetical protein R2795_05760 [Saprospiraceae bacterium]